MADFNTSYAITVTLNGLDQVTQLRESIEELQTLSQNKRNIDFTINIDDKKLEDLKRVVEGVNASSRRGGSGTGTSKGGDNASIVRELEKVNRTLRTIETKAAITTPAGVPVDTPSSSTTATSKTQIDPQIKKLLEASTPSKLKQKDKESDAAVRARIRKIATELAKVVDDKLAAEIDDNAKRQRVTQEGMLDIIKGLRVDVRKKGTTKVRAGSATTKGDTTTQKLSMDLDLGPIETQLTKLGNLIETQIVQPLLRLANVRFPTGVGVVDSAAVATSAGGGAAATTTTGIGLTSDERAIADAPSKIARIQRETEQEANKIAKAKRREAEAAERLARLREKEAIDVASVRARASKEGGVVVLGSRFGTGGVTSGAERTGQQLTADELRRAAAVQFTKSGVGGDLLGSSFPRPGAGIDASFLSTRGQANTFREVELGKALQAATSSPAFKTILREVALQNVVNTADDVNLRKLAAGFSQNPVEGFLAGPAGSTRGKGRNAGASATTFALDDVNEQKVLAEQARLLQLVTAATNRVVNATETIRTGDRSLSKITAEGVSSGDAAQLDFLLGPFKEQFKKREGSIAKAVADARREGVSEEGQRDLRNQLEREAQADFETRFGLARGSLPIFRDAPSDPKDTRGRSSLGRGQGIGEGLTRQADVARGLAAFTEELPEGAAVLDPNTIRSAIRRLRLVVKNLAGAVDSTSNFDFATDKGVTETNRLLQGSEQLSRLVGGDTSVRNITEAKRIRDRAKAEITELEDSLLLSGQPLQATRRARGKQIAPAADLAQALLQAKTLIGTTQNALDIPSALTSKASFGLTDPASFSLLSNFLAGGTPARSLFQGKEVPVGGGNRLTGSSELDRVANFLADQFDIAEPTREDFREGAKGDKSFARAMLEFEQTIKLLGDRLKEALRLISTGEIVEQAIPGGPEAGFTQEELARRSRAGEQPLRGTRADLPDPVSPRRGDS